MQKFLLTQLTPSRKLIWAARVGGADQAPTAPTPFLGQGLEIRAVVVTAGGHAVARAHTAHGAEVVVLGAAATERANQALPFHFSIRVWSFVPLEYSPLA